MGLRDTVLGWMRQGQKADRNLEKAEEDIVAREYEAEKTDAVLASRLGRSGDHFDADEQAPR